MTKQVQRVAIDRDLMNANARIDIFNSLLLLSLSLPSKLPMGILFRMFYL